MLHINMIPYKNYILFKDHNQVFDIIVYTNYIDYMTNLFFITQRDQHENHENECNYILFTQLIS